MEEKLEAKEEWIPAEDFNTGLTADDWKEILEDNDFIKKHPAGSIALWLYYDNRDDTPLSYTGLAEKYGIYDGYYKGGMGIFNTLIAISSKFKDKIRPFTDEKGKEVYWYLSFMARKPEKGEVGTSIFKLRKEVREGFEKLSEERKREFEKMYQNKKGLEVINNTSKIWVVSAGEKGNLWDDFVTNKRISIGWDKGDLTNKEPSSQNLRCFKEAKIGDFVFARKGAQSFIGFGRIDSEYKYDESNEGHKNTRSVTWLEIWTEQQKKSNAFYNEKQPFIELKNKFNETSEIKEIINKYTNNLHSYISSSNTNKNCRKEYQLSKKEEAWKHQLLVSHQIILTGAPGTGKTYAAKKIARELTKDFPDTKDVKHVDIVQFHSSMDYTDFVEGLRPIKENGQIGFVRQDGIFKKFCANAADNWNISHMSQEEQKTEQTIKSDFNSFIEQHIEDETTFYLKRNGKFTIIEGNEKNLRLYAPGSQATEGNVSISVDKILKSYRYFFIELGLSEVKTGAEIEKVVFNGTSTSQANYIRTIINKFHDFHNSNQKTNNTTYVPQKTETFVFIIDEINRGDIAKIFGELFYAIDPSYRGINGKITTQYQSLVDTPPFDKGFYVPENVYIIGTMNDIDRGVESMDFAIRRRFTWIEVDPKDTQNMLDSLDKKGEATKKMDALNAVIKDKIGPAYQIGAAYFMKLKHDELNGDFDALWEYHLEPLLREYLRGEPAEEIKKKISDMKNVYDNPPKNEKSEITESNASDETDSNA